MRNNPTATMALPTEFLIILVSCLVGGWVGGCLTSGSKAPKWTPLWDDVMHHSYLPLHDIPYWKGNVED